MHEIPNLPFPSLHTVAKQRSQTDTPRQASSERPEERSAKARTESPAPRTR